MTCARAVVDQCHVFESKIRAKFLSLPAGFPKQQHTFIFWLKKVRVVHSLLLCHLRHRFCHLLVVTVDAVIVVIFVIVVVVVAMVAVIRAGARAREEQRQQ